jgi:hypothetical protein
MTMKIICAVEIDDDTITGVLDSAFAYVSWWEGIDLAAQGTNTEEAFAGHVMSGGAVVVTMDDKYGDKPTLLDWDKHYHRYKLDRVAVERGLQELANNDTYKHHFTDIMRDNADAVTGHVLVQFALFGDVIFD